MKSNLVDDNSCRIVTFLGARGGSGTTSLAVAMAKNFADKGNYVLYIDFNLDNPVAFRYFGVEAKKLQVDLAQALQRPDVNIEQLLIATPYRKKIKLVSGSDINAIGDAINLSLDTCKRLIQLAADRFDVVIVDCAPNVLLETTAAACLCATHLITITEPDQNLLPYILKLKAFIYTITGKDKLLTIIQNKVRNRQFSTKQLQMLEVENLGAIYLNSTVEENNRLYRIIGDSVYDTGTDNGSRQTLNNIFNYTRANVIRSISE